MKRPCLVSVILLTTILVAVGSSCIREDRLSASQELYDSRRFEQCKGDLNKLLAKDKENIEARVLLARTELALGEHRDALENIILLPLETIKESKIDYWYLDHLSRSTEGDLYTPLQAVAPKDSKYAWSRIMLARTAIALGDKSALLAYLTENKDIIKEDPVTAASAWTFAVENTEDMQFVCQIASALGLKYKQKLADVFHGSDEDISRWLPVLTASDDPDLGLQAALQYLSIQDYQAGLDLITKIENNKALPADTRLFSATKYSLLVSLPELELTEKHLANLTMDDLNMLASFKQFRDKTSFANILEFIDATDDPQKELIRSTLFPPAPPRKETAIAGKPGYYSTDCWGYSLSPDGKNLLWIDCEGSYWWNAGARKVVKLGNLTDAVCWSSDSKYVAQWKKDNPGEVLIRRAADMDIIGRAPLAKKVLGWADEKLYVAGTDAVYQYTAAGEQTAKFDIPANFTPYLTPSGALGYVAIADGEILVKSGKLDKAFPANIGDVNKVLWLADDAGLLIHTESHQLHTTSKNTYYILDFASGELAEIAGLGESFVPMFDRYLWDGRTLYGYVDTWFHDGFGSHLFSYDVLPAQLTHTGIIFTLEPDMLAISASTVSEPGSSIILHKLNK